ncbi:MAG: hypothetical protein MJ238_00140, partial [Bacilli bacterium]|nr:hypothetical protein [Bacilli bacterium]
MIDLAYVKKKRRKKIAAIAGGVGTLGAVALIILAMLGRRIGNFTVKMENHGVTLGLLSAMEENDSTTFMSLNATPEYAPYQYAHMMDHNEDSYIDSKESNGQVGDRTDGDGNVTGMYFFKYTFFVKNLGKTDAIYNTKFFIDDSTKPSNVNYDLADLLRVKYFDNAATSDEHAYDIYAKKEVKSHYDENGKENYDAYVGLDDTNAIFGGYATQFQDDETVFYRTGSELKAGESRRITFVMWLEVTDAQA